MTKSRRESDAAVLESYRVALENVSSQEQISNSMRELGYDDAALAEGRNLLEESLKKYLANQEEDSQSLEAYDRFENLWAELGRVYNLDRKKAKVVFKNDPAILERLDVLGPKPKIYINWLDSVKKFYHQLNNDEALQQQIARLKLTPEQVQNMLSQLQTLDKARADYLKEKGESQSATEKKDEALARIDNWMSEFYAVARIALEDDPQLLEALSKTVKSN